MEDRKIRCSRRKFLAQAAAALSISGGLSSAQAGSAPPATARPGKPSAEGRRPLAVLSTVYRPLSYAALLTSRFLHGYPQGSTLHVPGQYVRTLHVDQTPDNDLSREVGREFGIHVTRSVEDALTAGTGRLAVEGVLLLAEHGNYPRNDRGQILYPRHELLEQVVSVFRRTGQRMPVFVAKHLSHRWDKASQMVAWARDAGFPLLAGSCVPLTWRRPEVELPPGCPVEEALVTAFGPVEVAGSDALDALQALVERRRGGEVGVRAVTCLTGQAVWRAGDEGLWSWGLLDAALERSESAALGDVRRNVGRVAVQGMPQVPPTAFLVEYRDGLRGTVLLLNGHVQDFCFAARVQGETRPVSCLFHQPPLPGARAFDCLAAMLERFFETGQPPFPVERALLTAGVLEVVMDSHARRGPRIETPHLEVSYRPPVESHFARTPPLSVG
ncbi:MAG: hypothetical protein L0Z62_31165 [Gemmataceae bacterium]|nr:hypothetical protein [Gemmataceae bacterium]